MPDLASDLGATLSNQAMIDLAEQRFAEARDWLDRAREWQRKALAANSRHPQYLRFMRQNLTGLAQVCAELADAAGAAEARRALADLEAGDPRFEVLDARLDVIAKGEVAKDNAERLALAQRAYDTQRYAQAARFWGEALNADPKLGDDRQTQHRYNAACAAALAAREVEVENAATLRAKALAWLRAEVAVWEGMVDRGTDEERSLVVRTLKQWQGDSDLVSVREEGALVKLPEEEREGFVELWNDVAQLLARVETVR